MKNRLMFVGGLGLGAGLMYVLDPDRGMRRRALLRDKARHLVNETGRAIEDTSHDVGNRARGLIAETKSYLRREQVSDEVLQERVRSRMGRAVLRPKNVEVNVSNGCVTLRGVVRESEVTHLMKCVSRVHGVAEIVSQLKIVKRHGADGATQHEDRRTSSRRSGWSGPVRLLATLVGSGMAFYGARRRGAVGTCIGTVGAGLLARGLTEFRTQNVRGTRARTQGTADISAPVRQGQAERKAHVVAA